MIDYIYTKDPIHQAADRVAEILLKHLTKKERVLWLLSGGSSSKIAVLASKKLVDVDLSDLYVSMTDERYGELGHKDENWQQLLDMGLNLTGANIYRPLIGADLDTTTTTFNEWLTTQFNKADFKLGIFGIGSDGHTAGIKPLSSAAKSHDLATSTAANDFTRITITFEAIRRFDEIIMQVSGESKRAILNDVLHNSPSLEKQPAQILKTTRKTSLYTNIQEEG